MPCCNNVNVPRNKTTFTSFILSSLFSMSKMYEVMKAHFLHISSIVQGEHALDVYNGNQNNIALP